MYNQLNIISKIHITYETPFIRKHNEGSWDFVQQKEASVRDNVSSRAVEAAEDPFKTLHTVPY